MAIGDKVEAGDLLAILDSSEAGRLKTELIASLDNEHLKQTTVDRIRPLAGGAIPKSQLLESEAQLQQAASGVDRIVGLLANLGITVDIDRIRKLSGKERELAVSQLGLRGLNADLLPKNLNRSNLIAVTAPLDGQVVSVGATLGEVMDRGGPDVSYCRYANGVAGSARSCRRSCVNTSRTEGSLSTRWFDSVARRRDQLDQH